MVDVMVFDEEVVYDDGRISIVEIADTPWNVPFRFISTTSTASVNFPGAAILPITEDGHVVLVHQHRPALGWVHTSEIPRGGAEPGESPEQCAVRELYEETGLVPLEVAFLGDVEPDNGIISSSVPVFFARVHNVDATFISDETTVSVMTLDDFKQAIVDNEIKDAFTCYAAFVAQLKGLI